MSATIQEFKFNYIESDYLLNVSLNLCEKCYDNLFCNLNSGTIIKIDLSLRLPMYYIRNLANKETFGFNGTCQCITFLKPKSITFLSYKGKIRPRSFYDEEKWYEYVNKNIECLVLFYITNSVRKQLLK